jgi:hypothetical protein
MPEAYRKIKEVSGSPELQEMKKGFETGEFATISAFKGDRTFEENMEMGQKLFHILQGMGLRVIPIRGHWEGSTEYSYFVFDISNHDVFKLSQDFKQDAVLWGEKGHFWLMNTDDGSIITDGTDFHIVQPGESFQNYSETLGGEKFVLQ